MFPAVLLETPFPTFLPLRVQNDPLTGFRRIRNQVEVVIPPRRYRKRQRDYYRLHYKERNIVERFINRIKWYQRIFTRYEKLAQGFLAFLHFAATLVSLKRNVNAPKFQELKEPSRSSVVTKNVSTQP